MVPGIFGGIFQAWQCLDVPKAFPAESSTCACVSVCVWVCVCASVCLCWGSVTTHSWFISPEWWTWTQEKSINRTTNRQLLEVPSCPFPLSNQKNVLQKDFRLRNRIYRLCSEVASSQQLSRGSAQHRKSAGCKGTPAPGVGQNSGSRQVLKSMWNLADDELMVERYCKYFCISIPWIPAVDVGTQSFEPHFSMLTSRWCAARWM